MGHATHPWYHSIRLRSEEILGDVLAESWAFLILKLLATQTYPL